MAGVRRKEAGGRRREEVVVHGVSVGDGDEDRGWGRKARVEEVNGGGDVVERADVGSVFRIKG